MSLRKKIFTIGHSIHPYDRFLSLLKEANVEAIADVRTSPYSNYLPIYNKDNLKHALRRDGLAYAFLGTELGGRPKSNRFYTDGIADYERMATAPAFRKGIGRLLQGAQHYRIALMCSEQDPLDCHRCLLVGRALSEGGTSVAHILPDGRICGHGQIEERLLKLEKQEEQDLFLSLQDRLARAYRTRAKKVAYADQLSGSLE